MSSSPPAPQNAFQIRDARPEDKDAIRELTVAAYAEYRAFLGENYHFYEDSMLATLADIGPAAQIVAEQDGQLVGAALLFPPGTAFEAPEGMPAPVWPELRLVAVPPFARGRGIGKALVADALRRARQDGCTGLALHTTNMMQTAMQLYERMGFVRTPEFDFFPVPEFHVLAYRLDFTD